MSVAMQSCKFLLAILFAAGTWGCEDPPAGESAGESAKPKASAVSAPVPTPVVSAKPPPAPRDDCPDGSSGIGTFDEPCKGSGTSRMMEVRYTGKTTDEGPKFSVTNKSKLPILHGSIAVYFYDKAGKQLEVASSEKPRPNKTCSGNIFAGQVKPDEKIYVFFSCVKKSHVPEGTVTIEAEAQKVGFADESGKTNEFYWLNEELVPDARPKGGVKSKRKSK